jgi:hypothetical protein
MTMGFNVDTFNFILWSGFGVKWYEEPLPHPDATGGGGSRSGR